MAKRRGTAEEAHQLKRRFAAVESFESLRNNVDNPNICFVFPSELTARFWCKHALRISSRKSIPLHRFLSWDQFKESCLVFPEAGRPANRAVRLLFLHEFLEQNSRHPRLRQIIPRRYAREPHVFLEPLERLLPVLHRVEAVRKRLPRFSRDKLDDLKLLYTTYREFLQKSQLFEPNYGRPQFSPGDRSYILFFPELIEDFSEFADLLTDRIELIPVPGIIRPGSSVRVFETLPEEIRATVQRMAALLDGGSDASEIILTVGNLGELEPLLRQEAELFDLPLDFHLGRPLSEFPQTRLFYKAYSAAETGFSLQTMKALLLCRSIPWKQERLCRALVRLALDGRIPGNTAGMDNWALSIESGRRNRNPRKLPLSRISGFYSTLKQHLSDIAAVVGFAELKACLVAFSAAFLDLTQLNEEEVKIFQFAMDSLDELERADELVASWRATGDAGYGQVAPAGRMHSTGAARRGQIPVFPLWWMYLSQRLYVPRRSAPGISVYPFRVSAGMQPKHHYLINASQAATSHTLRRYPFLKLHEEQHLSDVRRELSTAHLQLYSYSGDDVMFSYARRDYQRSNLPPPAFLTQGLSIAEASGLDPADAYELERKAWIDGNSFPLHTLQHVGYASAAIGCLRTREIDTTKQILQDPLLTQVLGQRLWDDENRLRISATALEIFSLCPFQFLFERLLEVSAEEYEPTMIDAIEFGQLLHSGLDVFFTNIHADDAHDQGMLLSGRREEYRRHLKGIVSRLCSGYQRKRPTLLAPISAEIQRRIEELLLAFLEVELETMADERIEGSEVRLKALAADPDTVLVGYIDRLNRNATGYTLIDYKKKHVPARGDLFSEEPRSLQMPFYIHLMEQNDLPVTRAAYYSFENRRYHFVLGSPKTNMGTPEELRRSIEGVKQRIVTMRKRISEGDYRIGISGAADCSGCRLREICRSEYATDG
ncbi:MAG: PD-(D/E)XK nuclease family protein [Spirochaetaceae bacterium]|nr:MAG: PD-(D/E)XK nuclease family protein [Spirochaetaceae bacterium]